jgi:uncharacterized protein with ParB-like and HNH nuclease domain
LIESILLKLPLPVFYFDVSNPEKWEIVDGLQRISTIRQFFNNPGFRLKGLEFLTHLNGKKSGELDRTMQRTISETQFITYQIEAQTPKEVRYSIFNRINTGGLSLKPQEIRQALNQAGLGVNFLTETVKDNVFKRVVGISNKRMAGQESPTKNNLFFRNNSLSFISSKQIVSTSNNDKLTNLFLLLSAIDLLNLCPTSKTCSENFNVLIKSLFKSFNSSSSFLSISSIAKSKKLLIILNLSSLNNLNAIKRNTNSCPAILLLEIPTTLLKTLFYTLQKTFCDLPTNC